MRHGNLLCQPNIDLSHLGRCPLGRRGQIEIGQDDDSQSFVRALDMGGMVWEGKPKYNSLDNALNDLEAALKKTLTD